MTIQTRYRKPSPQIPTYDYVDISDGTGYVDYYGLAVSSSGAPTTEYELVRQTTIPSNTDLDYTSIPEDSTQELNFDVEYNTIRVMKGKAILSLPITANSLNAGAENFDVTIGCSLYHVDANGTETQLGTYVSGAVGSSGSIKHWGKRFTGIIEVSTEKVFVKGEKARLSLNVTCSNSGNSNSEGRVYHEPLGTSDTFDFGDIKGGKMVVSLPFRIYQ